MHNSNYLPPAQRSTNRESDLAKIHINKNLKRHLSDKKNTCTVHKFPADPSWLKFYSHLFSDNHNIMSSAVIWFCWIMAKNIKFSMNAIWINIFFLPATKLFWLITIWCKKYEELKNTSGIITVNRTKQSRTWALVTWSMALNPSQETHFPGGSVVKNLPANAGDPGSSPGWGSSPGEGNGNPLQYSCLENPMDRGAWRATVQGVVEELNLT